VGLVQYVEPTGTLLGDITTFREVFCSEDDRTLITGQEHELQTAIGDGAPAGRCDARRRSFSIGHSHNADAVFTSTR